MFENSENVTLISFFPRIWIWEKSGSGLPIQITGPDRRKAKICLDPIRIPDPDQTHCIWYYKDGYCSCYVTTVVHICYCKIALLLPHIALCSCWKLLVPTMFLCNLVFAYLRGYYSSKIPYSEYEMFHFRQEQGACSQPCSDPVRNDTEVQYGTIQKQYDMEWYTTIKIRYSTEQSGMVQNSTIPYGTDTIQYSGRQKYSVFFNKTAAKEC